MAQVERVVCASAALEEGGQGVRFEVMLGGKSTPAFVVRYGGLPRAFINQCAHLPRELDWTPGHFFDESKTLLVCSLHGALYYPDSGKCYLGPCHSGGLLSLACRDSGSHVVIDEPPSS